MDALNFYPIMDKKMLDLFEPFNTKYTITSLGKEFSLAKYLTLLSTGNQIVSYFLKNRAEDIKNCKVSSRLKMINI